jgi:hypothetical protein
MKKTALLILTSTFKLFSFIPTDDLLKQLIAKIEKYNETYPQEKAYLHTDKPYYVVGEKLWFKAYLVEGMTNRPDTVSVPLYIDLIDNSAGKLIDRRIVKLEGGFGHGDFTLPDSLSAGFYRLRAYTNWMRNFDETQYFIKDFQVYSLDEQPIAEKLNAEAIDFQFFPEGGNLVEGFDNRIAFKATDGAGKGLVFSGEIIASTGDTIQSFRSEYLGMGFCSFKPESGKNYRAVVKYRDNYTKIFDLTQVQKQGISMILDNISNKNNIRLSLNSSLKDTEMLIIGQSKGVVFYAGKIPSGKANAFITIPKDKFPPGVAQFTVFDKQFRPHAERLAFIQPTKELIFKIKSDKNTYKTREKTNLEIEVKDTDNQPVEGNFSLVVSDENQIKGLDEQETILSNLLMSSDVKGNIENPAYYFDKSNRKANFHLDILLMTQGWRRFSWQDVLQEELPPTRFLLERGLTVSGEATKMNGKSFDKTVNLTMVLGKDSTQQFLMGELEKNGSFLFYGLDFRDSCEVMLQAMIGEESAKSKLMITPQIAPPISKKVQKNWVLEENKASLGLNDYLKYTKEAIELQRKIRLDNSILLNEIAVKAKKYVEPKKDSRVLYPKAEAVVKGDASPSALNVFELLRGRVPGVYIGGDRNRPTIAIRPMMASMNVSGSPLFLLDGAPVKMESLLGLDINSIDRVEVIKSLSGAVMYGDQARGGIISVFTKMGNPDYKPTIKEDVKGVVTTTLMGYYTTKEFFVPKYDQDLPQNLRPDYRSTVYWSPMIQTDKGGKAKVSYFNTDAETSMRISIEGLSIDGLIGVGNQKYDVKK